MSRKPPPDGRCVHCLRDGVRRNWDHLFPRSWYPDSTPPNLAKWIIPTCHKCNTEYGGLENELLTLLGMCVDPNAAASSGIAARVLRGLDPECASNEKDKMARLRKRERFLKGLIHGDDIPDSGIYPGLGERWGRPKGSGLAIKIPERSFRLLAEKIVRGITFIESGQFIEPSHRIDFYALNDTAAGEVKELLSQHGKEYARGAGIKIVRAVLPEDGVSTIMSIDVWESIIMYVSVVPAI
jgi:hypothetical protein